MAQPIFPDLYDGQPMDVPPAETFTPRQRYPQPGERVWLNTHGEPLYEGEARVSVSSPDHWEILFDGTPWTRVYIGVDDEYRLLPPQEEQVTDVPPTPQHGDQTHEGVWRGATPDCGVIGCDYSWLNQIDAGDAQTRLTWHGEYGEWFCPRHYPREEQS